MGLQSALMQFHLPTVFCIAFCQHNLTLTWQATLQHADTIESSTATGIGTSKDSLLAKPHCLIYQTRFLLDNCIHGYCLTALQSKCLCCIMRAAMLVAFATLTLCSLLSILAQSADSLAELEP